MRLFALVMVVVTLTGCAATGPKYSEHQADMPALDQDTARVFFFRNSKFASSGGDAEIFVNDEKVGECADGAYFYVDTAPGLAKIRAENAGAYGTHVIEKQLEGGTEYYIEVVVNETYVYSGSLPFVADLALLPYVALNENVGPWYFRETPKVEAVRQLQDKVFSLDGE